MNSSPTSPNYRPPSSSTPNVRPVRISCDCSDPACAASVHTGPGAVARVFSVEKPKPSSYCVHVDDGTWAASVLAALRTLNDSFSIIDLSPSASAPDPEIRVAVTCKVSDLHYALYHNLEISGSNS